MVMRQEYVLMVSNALQILHVIMLSLLAQPLWNLHQFLQDTQPFLLLRATIQTIDSVGIIGQTLLKIALLPFPALAELPLVYVQMA
jgi:hypothetical protein